MEKEGGEQGEGVPSIRIDIAPNPSEENGYELSKNSPSFRRLSCGILNSLLRVQVIALGFVIVTIGLLIASAATPWYHIEAHHVVPLGTHLRHSVQIDFWWYALTINAAVIDSPSKILPATTPTTTTPTSHTPSHSWKDALTTTQPKNPHRISLAFALASMCLSFIIALCICIFLLHPAKIFALLSSPPFFPSLYTKHTHTLLLRIIKWVLCVVAVVAFACAVVSWGSFLYFPDTLRGTGVWCPETMFEGVAGRMWCAPSFKGTHEGGGEGGEGGGAYQIEWYPTSGWYLAIAATLTSLMYLGLLLFVRLPAQRYYDKNYNDEDTDVPASRDETYQLL